MAQYHATLTMALSYINCKVTCNHTATLDHGLAMTHMQSFIYFIQCNHLCWTRRCLLSLRPLLVKDIMTLKV